MATYKISNYQGVRIECWTPKHLVGLNKLLRQEGCPNSENVFTDKDMAIELDDVQRMISQKHHTDKKASADILLHVNGNKLLLADAKFRVTNIKNLDAKELSKKITESKALVKTDYSFLPNFYILMKKQALSPTHLNAVRRMFSNKPNYRVMDTINFHALFED